MPGPGASRAALAVESAYVGAAVPLKEDVRFLRGEGRFIGDIATADALHVAFVRSSLASAVIESIDTAEAERLPGVVKILTGAEWAAAAGPIPLLHVPDERFAGAVSLRLSVPPVQCMAVDRVRYVGEPVCAVVARDRCLAEDAVELVVVDYEPLPAVLSPHQAVAEGAPSLYEECPGNVGTSLEYGLGELPGDDREAIVVEGSYEIGRQSGVPLECRGVVASYDATGDRVELWTSTQVPHFVQRAVCAATGWPPERVRVRVPDVGGGFGPKANVYGEEPVVAYLARELEAEVAWIEDRREHLLSAAQGRDQRHETRLTVDRDGRILAWEDRFDVDIGAHSLWIAGVVANTALHLLGPYRIPACHISGRGVFTNKAPSAQYRGAGRPEACFALERSLDRAARLIGVDPCELRRRNLLSKDDLPYRPGIPYRDGVDVSYDGRDYRAVFEACLDLVSEREVEEIRDAEESRGRRVGVGVATYVEATGRGPYESARVALTRTGQFLVATGAACAGQGHETTLAQVAADALGVPLDRIDVSNGDTDAVALGVGGFASRTAVAAGSAVHLAARELARTIVELAARALGTDEGSLRLCADGLRDREARPVASWHELAGLIRPGGAAGGEPVVECLHRFEPPTVTWTMGAHLAVVGVDPASGAVSVLRYAAADEGGTPINPAVVEGQIRGGVAQGIGGALTEQFLYDETGQPLSTTLVDYLLPTAVEVPAIRLAHERAPSELNPLGVRGVGESGVIPVGAAIAAAVDDALADLGVHIRAVPISRELVQTWVRERGCETIPV